MQDRAAMLLHALSGLGKMRHALAEFANNPATFLFAHLIETIQHLGHLVHHGGLKFLLVLGVGGGIEGAGNSQDGIQVRHRGQRKLGRRSAICGDVSADQFTIQGKRLARRSLQA